MVCRAIITWLMLFGTVYAAPNNYGVTHDFAVHLSSTFAQELGATDNEGKIIGSAVGMYYIVRELKARKNSDYSKDSLGDLILPAVAVGVEWFFPELKTKIYQRSYLKPENSGKDMCAIYITLYGVSW